MTWSIRDAGFDMLLSGQVPAAIHDALGGPSDDDPEGAPARHRPLGGASWRPLRARCGGESARPRPAALAASREVLRRFGNMSSATVMFVLEVAASRRPRAERGCAMSFGPGLVAETMLFLHGQSKPDDGARRVEPERLDILPPEDLRAIGSRHDLRRVNIIMFSAGTMAQRACARCKGEAAAAFSIWVRAMGQ